MITKNYFKVVRVFPDPSDYFYIKNESYDTGVITLDFNPETKTDVEYKIDNGSWTNLVQAWPEEGYAALELQPNSKLYFRGTSGYFKDSEGGGMGINFDEISAVSIGGDLRTLLDYTDVDSVTTIPENCFIETFNNNNLISIDNLTLGSSVTTLGNYAMNGMFTNSQIQKGLDLSGVTTLGNYAMSAMYQFCYSLNEAYAPNVSTWNTGKTNVWLSSVAPTGVLYKPANLTIPTDNASGVPSGWTTQTYPQN